MDTRTLGLKGLQVVAGTQDIGAGSSTHTVAQILADTSNTTAVPGYADLLFAGPGFSDGSKINIAVNHSGVTDIATLATSINRALQSAGNGVSQAATAFKDAGVVRGAVNGGQQLQFSSSTTAFQVEAGRSSGQRPLGNLSGTTGTAIPAL